MLPAALTTKVRNSSFVEAVEYGYCLPLTSTSGVPGKVVSSEPGMSPPVTAVVRSSTHLPYRWSSMHCSIVEPLRTPGTVVTTSASCSSVRPGVPSSGCAANSARFTAKNESGDSCATQAAAFAARREYFVPWERFVRIATGCTSRVAAPESTSPSMYSLFVCSNEPQIGQR
ncbi:hypothetical protein DEJ15_17010 [Curtobacterium sp. MCJR17_043]|nr:hypothetical protein [Curtobacterium sp. MCJR17_043]WIB35772.1 hypothetical protein DEJ15_17010 [Curtobacterium sp. MCJR17_043]